jgi:heme exporter protein B
MARNWDREREFDAIRALLLSPLPRAGIYLGKTLGVLCFLICVELVVLLLVAFLFQLDLLPLLGPLLAVVALGTLGFAASGTLFSALTVRTKARDLMLTVVLFPLVAPALLSSVVATRELFAGAHFQEIWGWLELLIGFDVLSLTLGIVLFDALISD